ncbi:hypothetical protein MMC12_008341 [Toensbergia leucococca]|nr:hypothetical protein [Toensbergia leucococca]
MALWSGYLSPWKKSSPSSEKYSLLQEEESKPKQPATPFTGCMLELITPRVLLIVTGLDALLSLVIIVLLIVNALRIPRATKSPIPDFPTKPDIWTRHKGLEFEFGPGSYERWNEVIPGGTGFILIDQPRQYDLPPGLPTVVEDAEVYGVSVTHQFHCIKMIRDNFWGFVSGNATYINKLSPPKNHSEPLPRMLEHTFHCLDYLRLTVLCNADMTIEYESVGPSGNIDGYGGYGVPHQCKDWDQVRGWMASRMPPEKAYQIAE